MHDMRTAHQLAIRKADCRWSACDQTFCLRVQSHLLDQEGRRRGTAVSATRAIKSKDENSYERAFRQEAARSYPEIDKLVRRIGWDLDCTRLLNAARVLACPVKVNDPCWQHGRVVYALVRRVAEAKAAGRVVTLDIGTAKGFSALCAAWAIADAKRNGTVYSVDVIHPFARVKRNSIADLNDTVPTLHELVDPFWPADIYRSFMGGGSEKIVDKLPELDFAFIDGKHDFEHVQHELLAAFKRVPVGAHVLVDDTQVIGVARAVKAIADKRIAEVEWINVLPHRGYALLRKAN